MSTKQAKRQYERNILVELGPGNMGAGNEVTARLPQGAWVTNVVPVTETAFNSGTTATMTVTDGTTVFVNAQDVKTTGIETAAVTQKYYPQGGTLTCSLGQTGTAATSGRALVKISYLQSDVEDEIRD